MPYSGAAFVKRECAGLGGLWVVADHQVSSGTAQEAGRPPPRKLLHA